MAHSGLIGAAAESHAETLDLSGMYETRSLPSALWELTHLKVLRLAICGLDRLPDEIGRLINLQMLDLSGNQLAGLPESIGELVALRTLNLANNQLVSLPKSILNLADLRELDLRINRLRRLPDELGALEELEILRLDENKLVEPPQAVASNGTSAILGYLRGRLDPQSQPQWRSKLIIVGEAAVGKTSLTRMLAGESFDPDEQQTHGIRTTNLVFPHPEHAASMTLHTWDFGGQEIYHATHRFFLTDQSLFLAVWSSRDGYSKGQLRTWLQAITARAPTSPILLVATHCDEHPADLPLTQLRSEFPRIVGSVHIDSQTNRGREELESAIARAAALLPLMGHRWPKSWLDAAEALRAHGETEVYTTPAVMRQIMASAGVRSVRNQDAVARVLHSLGELLYFGDDAALADIVVTKPKWVNDQITAILDSEELLTCKGVLSHSLLQRVWAEIDAPVRRHLISMMEQFDLAYRIDSDSADDVCLVVEKLPEEAADFREIWAAAGNGAAEIRLVYDFSQFLSLQAGVPTWFIAREHRFTTGMHWRYGTLLHSRTEKAWALLTANPLSRSVELSVRGPFPVAFFSELKASFERILTQRYPGAPYRLLVPCPCERDRQAAPCPHMFEYDDLRRRLEPARSKEYIECPKSLDDVYVRGLIEGFQPRTLDEIRQMLRNVGEKVERIDSRQLLALDFLRNISEWQRAQEVRCPSLFLITAERKRILRERVTTLQFYCEYPQEWHPTGDDGRLRFTRAPDWFVPIAPHLRLIVQILRHASPLVAPAAAALGFALDEQTKAGVELMKEFVDQIPQLSSSRSARVAMQAEETPVRLAYGEADYRWLVQALNELDPGSHWGGLQKTDTPDGLTIFVCDKHKKMLDYPSSGP